MVRGFGHDDEVPPARAPWAAPDPPAEPARATYAVRWSDLDSLAHVNNATYLDVLTETTLAAMLTTGARLTAGS